MLTFTLNTNKIGTKGEKMYEKELRNSLRDQILKMEILKPTEYIFPGSKQVLQYFQVLNSQN